MLDIRDYDLAVVDRIKLFFDNTHFIMRPVIPIKEIRDRKVLNGDDIDFPLITVRRTNCPIISKDYNSWSRAKSGQTYITSPDDSIINNLFKYDSVLAKMIVDSGHRDGVSVVNSTFELTYYVDVISLERDNFDTLMVELQENLFRIPYVSLKNIKSNGEQDKLVSEQSCHLILEEVEDTSDLENFDSGNALYRATITLKMNAYIFRKYKELALELVSMKLKSGNDFEVNYEI